MDCTTFHLFPRLPCELRLMIWELAIRPASNNYAGIQSFSVVATQNPRYGEYARYDASNGEYIESYVASLDEGQGNRSAYLWDAGLWTACPESREVIMSKSNINSWRPEIYGIIASWAGGGSHREDWRVMVRPLHDVFKLDFKAVPASECGDWFGLCTREMMKQVPFGFLTLGRSSTISFILEFDPGWLDEWPRDFCDMIFEPKPRGFVANILREAAYKGCDLFVWLVDWRDYGADRDCHIRKRLRGDPSRVYYDLDEEFVEMDMDRCYQYWDSPERFIDRMQLYEHDVLEQLSINVREDVWGRYRVGTEKHVGVLRPKKLMRV